MGFTKIHQKYPHQCNILKHSTDLRRVRERAKWMTTSCPEPIYNCPLMNMRSPFIRCSQTTDSWSKSSQYMTLCLRWIRMSSMCFRNITAEKKHTFSYNESESIAAKRKEKSPYSIIPYCKEGMLKLHQYRSL